MLVVDLHRFRSGLLRALLAIKETGYGSDTQRRVQAGCVVGWAISNRMKQGLALRALNMAIAIRKPPPDCSHHTDRGSQYGAHDDQKLLRKHGFQVSMGGKGNCYDHSAVESLFTSPKAELIWRRNRQTRREVEVALFEYINGFRNPRRKHSALGWKSPVACDQRAA